MEDLKIKIINKLKNTKMVDFIYPSISTLLIAISLALFLISLNFISQHINKALSEENSPNSLLSLDKNNFEPIRKKFNIKIENNPDQQNTVSMTTTVASSSSTVPENNPAGGNSSSTTSETSTLEKSALVISILNGTKTSGLAASLKKTLGDSGFTVSNMGNTALASNTILKMKKSKEMFQESLTKAVSAKYTISSIEDLSETDPYDAIIIIGK